MALSLQFAITTIDFIFLEKINYKVAIGVSSVMTFVYMIQSIITLFSQAMVNNALYHYPNKDKNFFNTLAIGFVITVAISLLVIVVFALAKEQLLMLYKSNLSDEIKQYALAYTNYMLIFFLMFSISQYFIYILYALQLTIFNLLNMLLVLIFNTIYNYIAVYILKLEVEAIAISSSLAVISVLPFYIFIINKKYSIKSLFTINLKYYFNITKIGFKRLGMAALGEPILHQIIQYLIIITVVAVGSEALSARVHANNFLTFAIAMSLSFGIMIQLNTSELYGKGMITKAKEFYSKYVKLAFIISFIVTAIILVSIYYSINIYSTNSLVKDFIIITLIVALIMEPMRALSISSKAYLKGLQIANLPLLCSLAIKGLFVYPMIYFLIHYKNQSLESVLLIESFGYFLNFLAYSLLIKIAHKKIKAGL